MRERLVRKRSRRDDRELRQLTGLSADSVVRPLANFGRSTFGFDHVRALAAARQADRISEEVDERMASPLATRCRGAPSDTEPGTSLDTRRLASRRPAARSLSF
jgi:hypothetical protein